MLGSVVIARFVVVAFVDVELTVMKFVDVRFVIVATAAVSESAIAVVKRASVEKNDVDVAFVIVALVPLRLATVDEPNAMRPPLKVRSVDVAPFVNASWSVTPELSVPQIRTPAAVAFTSQDAALSEETVRFVVEALVEEMFVVVAFAATRFPKVLVPVKVLSLYVFAIVVEASAKCVAEVVENAAPWFWRRKYCADVVENERPAEAKYNEDEVEKKLFADFQ